MNHDDDCDYVEGEGELELTEDVIKLQERIDEINLTEDPLERKRMARELFGEMYNG